MYILFLHRHFSLICKKLHTGEKMFLKMKLHFNFFTGPYLVSNKLEYTVTLTGLYIFTDF